MKEIRPIVAFVILVLVSSCDTKKNFAKHDLKNPPLEETYWELKTIMGKPIEKKAGEPKEMYLKLAMEEHRIHASAGCNRFMGGYELSENNKITFTNLASTMMACPDNTTEELLKQVLEKTDHYSLKGTRLTLQKAKMAPLAVFEATKLKK